MIGVERVEFQRLLFRTAFCVMACDGEIDAREVDEIRSMERSTAFFQGIDLRGELDQLLSDLREKGRLFVDDLIKLLESLDLSTVQELLVLEVAFRLVNADERTDENEIRFLRVLRSKLHVHDQTIRDRFGPIDYLYGSERLSNVVDVQPHGELLSAIRIPDETQLARIDFTIDED